MYKIVIDESGDTGLEIVLADPSDGPTQYFTMCAALFSDENHEHITQQLDSLPFQGN